MIGYIGEVHKIRKLGRELLASFDFAEPLSLEEKARLAELNQQYWAEFQERPEFQVHLWKAWSPFLAHELEMIPVVLAYLYEKANKDAFANIHLKTDNWILRILLWDFFRTVEPDWSLREFLLRDYPELFYHEEEFLSLAFSSEQNLARRYYQDLIEREQLSGNDRERTMIAFVMQYYPGDDAKSALIIRLRDSGIDPLPFIN